MLQKRMEEKLSHCRMKRCVLLWGSSLLGLLLSTTTSLAIAQLPQGPQADLDNGVLHVTVDLPSASEGFYRGTRFDWSGVIASLTYAGHSYYGPWFEKMDPTVRDYIFAPPDIIAGKASADMGPVEEFTPLGFDSAKPGGTFVKIGVGILRKPDDKRYSSMHDYSIVDPTAWKVRAKRTSIEFTQRVVDGASGYGYLYTKTLRLVPGQPHMLIEHTLKNVGRLPIATDVYDHNFTVLDHQPIGPDYSVTLPFAVELDRPLNAELAAVEGNRIVYRRLLADHEYIDVHSTFNPPQTNNDIRVENSRVKAGVRITGDHPLTKFELWSIRSVMGIEPFIHLTAAPGETIHWRYNYVYYTLP
jgi:hypothetical protein